MNPFMFMKRSCREANRKWKNYRKTGGKLCYTLNQNDCHNNELSCALLMIMLGILGGWKLHGFWGLYSAIPSVFFFALYSANS
jgi:hypothetical protein